MNDTAVADAHSAHDHEAHHPSDVDYVKVAIGLAVLTAIEVALSYVGLEGPALLVPLLAVMAIKFVIVAGQFMHLKFDDKLLTRVFYAGLILAVLVYVAALTTFHVWSKGTCKDGGQGSTPTECLAG